MSAFRFARAALAALLAVSFACAQEHGAAPEHGAPPAAAPAAAPAAPKPTSCITCHDQQQGALKAPIADWLTSVHGKAGVSCDGCHGGDLKDDRLAHSPSAKFVGKPRLREVPYMCGKCHAEIKDKHVGSVHGANGLPHCVSCHGSHTVQKPDPQKIITPEACSKCHKYENAATAQAMLGKARTLLAELDEFAKKVEHVPGVVTLLHDMQKELHLDRAGVLSTFHSFRIGEIQQIGSNVDQVKKTIEKLIERDALRETNYTRERPFILALMGFFLLATVFGFFVFHGSGEVHHHHDEPHDGPGADAATGGAPHV